LKHHICRSHREQTSIYSLSRSPCNLILQLDLRFKYRSLPKYGNPLLIVSWLSLNFVLFCCRLHLCLLWWNKKLSSIFEILVVLKFGNQDLVTILKAHTGCLRFGLDQFWDKNSSDIKIKLLTVWFSFGWLTKKYDSIWFNLVEFNLDQFFNIQIIIF
jgi:hypothetical protein